MVLPLKPAKFYGSSLPRPRIYTDVKLSDERVDPPVPVLDPLMSWASDAHWSMGGLSFNRLRLQGKIEGNVKKLRKEIESKIHSNSPHSNKKVGPNRGGFESPPPAPISKKRSVQVEDEDEEEEEVDWDYESEVESVKEVKKRNGGLKLRKKRRLVRKLGDDFELVGSPSPSPSENGRTRTPLKDLSNGGGIVGVALRTRSRRSMVLMDDEAEGVDGGDKSKNGGVENGTPKSKNGKGSGSGFRSSNVSRSSPRLKKRSH